MKKFISLVSAEIADDIFFYGPEAVTTILNLFFFASTAIKIIRQKWATAQHLDGPNSKRHDEKSKERYVDLQVFFRNAKKKIVTFFLLVQIQSLLEALRRDGNIPAEWHHRLALPRPASGLHLVLPRCRRQSTGSDHLNYIRVEG